MKLEDLFFIFGEKEYNLKNNLCVAIVVVILV